MIRAAACSRPPGVTEHAGLRAGSAQIGDPSPTVPSILAVAVADRADAERTDEAWQLAVLTRVLALHPERLSADELRRETLSGRREVAVVDAHDRAVDDLVAAGLLRRDGDSVIATRAAMHFARLHG